MPKSGNIDQVLHVASSEFVKQGVFVDMWYIVCHGRVLLQLKTSTW